MVGTTKSQQSKRSRRQKTIDRWSGPTADRTEFLGGRQGAGSGVFQCNVLGEQSIDRTTVLSEPPRWPGGRAIAWHWSVGSIDRIIA